MQGLKNTPIHDLCNNTAHWRDLCIAHGILAHHFTPVLGNDNLPLGFFLLCFNAAQIPTDWEHQLAFGSQVASIVFERDRESVFRDMANHAPMMVWMTDSTGYCTFLSQSWYDFSGQTEKTSLGFGWLDTVHPSDRELAQNAFLKASKRGEAFHIEYRLRRQDGEYRWAINAANSWFGTDGQFQGFMSCIVDITERKQIEERLQLATEGTNLGMWYWDVATDTLTWTDRAKAMRGVLMDITALKHSETEREQALRSVAEAAESKLQEVLASIRGLDSPEGSRRASVIHAGDQS
ncbi:PAS domain S-box protein [Gloeocapsa sp. BRSZ]